MRKITYCLKTDGGHFVFVFHQNSLYFTDLYTIRSGIQIPLIGFIAVADRFTRTEITYIQVILPPYLKLSDVVNNIFRVPLYKSSK